MAGETGNEAHSDGELPPIDADYVRQINLYDPTEAEAKVLSYLNANGATRELMRDALNSTVRNELAHMIFYFDYGYEDEPEIGPKERNPDTLDEAIQITLRLREPYQKRIAETEEATAAFHDTLSVQPDNPIKKTLLDFIDECLDEFNPLLPDAQSALHMYLFQFYTSGFEEYAAKEPGDREQVQSNIKRYLTALTAHPGLCLIDETVRQLKAKSSKQAMFDRGRTDKATQIEHCLKELPLEAVGHIGDESYDGVGKRELKALHQAIASPRGKKALVLNEDGTIDIKKADQAFRTLKEKLKLAEPVNAVDVFDEHLEDTNRLQSQRSQ